MSRVAIVTGASSGIGLAFAQRWVARGGRVALVARTAARLAEIATDLGDRAASFPLDVLDRAGVAALPGRVLERFGVIDVLVNNAGAHHRGVFESRPTDDLVQMVETNLTAPILLTHAVLPRLAPGGSIVQVASLAGVYPVSGSATYSASKAGLRSFSRALAGELEGRDVHVGIVSPGPVDTGFLGDYTNVPDVVLAQPMSTAEEVADAILACIDEKIDEVLLPARSGRLAKLAALSPAIAKKLRPVMEKRGARNREALKARRRSVS